MEKHQKSQDNEPDVPKKRIYSKPVLTILGKVSELTTGGSTRQNENDEGGSSKNPRS